MPPRDGLGAARVRIPVTLRPDGGPWRSLADVLAHLAGDPAGIGRRIADDEVLLADGTPVTVSTPYRPGEVVYLYRDLPDEAPVPFEIEILLHDEVTGLLVVDKPPFISTMPRGGHVVQTVLTRLRRDLDLPELSPVHRLDRLTSGVLLLTTRAQSRSPYQRMVQAGHLAKTYEALAPVRHDLGLPVTVADRIVKERGELRARVVDGEPNARTRIELLDVQDGRGHYRLTPTTGRTHQLRLHLAGLGLPIEGDPLYPEPQEVAADDFSTPLQLLAREVRFTDPVNGLARRVTSPRALPLPGAP